MALDPGTATAVASGSVLQLISGKLQLAVLYQGTPEPRILLLNALVLSCAVDMGAWGSNCRCPVCWFGCLLVPCRSDAIACSSLRSMLESVGKRFGTALSPGGNPEQGYQLSRCDNVSTGHSTSAMNSCKCLCCCKEIKELGGAELQCKGSPAS